MHKLPLARSRSSERKRWRAASAGGGTTTARKTALHPAASRSAARAERRNVSICTARPRDPNNPNAAAADPRPHRKRHIPSVCCWLDSSRCRYGARNANLSRIIIAREATTLNCMHACFTWHRMSRQSVWLSSSCWVPMPLLDQSSPASTSASLVPTP